MEDGVKNIIDETVNQTVIKLKMAGLMKSERRTAFQKTEELLRNYEKFKEINDQPYTQNMVRIIEQSLCEIEEDEYFEIIPMIYFEGKTREEVAEYFDVNIATISRNKRRLINILKLSLFSDSVIYELFL